MKNNNKDLITEIKEMLYDFQNNSSKNWLRTSEAAEYLGLSETQIHTLKRNGILPFTKLGGSIYFKRQDIDEVLEANMMGE